MARIKLELLVEKSTSQEVVDHLRAGIRSMTEIPVIDVIVRRYRLPERRVVSENELRRLVGTSGICSTSSKTDLVVPDVDAVTKVTQWSPVYNLGRLIIDHSPDDGLRLIGTHQGWFTIAPTDSGYLRISGLKDKKTIGEWFFELGAGIVYLLRNPSAQNLKNARHEVLHGLGITDHHGKCVMEPTISYRKNLCDACIKFVMEAYS